jgi:hypothetical protein
MNKKYKILFVICAVLLILISTLIILRKPNTEPVTPKNEFKIHKNITEPTIVDTLIAAEPKSNVWPIRVESVQKSYEKNTPKWQVIAENGLMYYTNKKPKVGDIAFYINDNDDITDKYGRVERTR